MHLDNVELKNPFQFLANPPTEFEDGVKNRLQLASSRDECEELRLNCCTSIAWNTLAALSVYAIRRCACFDLK